MRTFDLAPLYRSTVGFDRLFSMLDGFESAPGYPPYNIEPHGEHDYRVTAELPGMSEKDIEISLAGDTLTVKGEKKEEREEKAESRYVAERRFGSFQRSFQRPEDADPERIEAGFKNGVLTVKLPFREEARPRTINVEVAA